MLSEWLEQASEGSPQRKLRVAALHGRPALPAAIHRATGLKSRWRGPDAYVRVHVDGVEQEKCHTHEIADTSSPVFDDECCTLYRSSPLRGR